MKTQVTSPQFTLAPWRARGIGLLRIVFGLVWAVDAWFKWQPDFIHKFTNYLSGALDGQPPAVQAWINFWINIVKVNPHVFAYLVAIGETAVAIGLIFGLLSNLTNIVGILLSLVIWSTAEGFGGPYSPGSTDIGSAIIYVLVFLGLFLASAGLYYGVDRFIDPLLGRWSFLASASSRRRARENEPPIAAQSDYRDSQSPNEAHEFPGCRLDWQELMRHHLALPGMEAI